MCEMIESATDSLVPWGIFKLMARRSLAIWGKNENTNIRLRFDNQVVEALKHFNEADAFTQSSN